MPAVSTMRALSIALAASGWLCACDGSPSSPSSPASPSIPEVELGNYTLTIAAASECGSGLGESNLPDDLRIRSYTAVVKLLGGSLWVEPIGPGFPARFPQAFYGTLGETGATFLVRNADDGLPISEQLSSSTAFLFEGNVVAAGSADGHWAGSLSGQLDLFETTTPWRRLASCSSKNHQFALSR
jgi:hypothetical protein